MDFANLILSDQGEQYSSGGCMSIATGIVKNNWDKDHPGMVQVELMMGQDGKKTTGWLRVMQPYTGPGYGTYFLPEVNSEVVIGFNCGDINEGIVLGSLWNHDDKLPEDTANDKNSKKLIKTKEGHTILLDETKDKEKVEITTKKNIDILLDDKNNKISIKDQKGENTVEIDGKGGQIKISAKKKISLSANGAEILVLDGTGKKASLKTGTIELNGSQKMDIQGASTNVQGNAMSISAKGNCTVESKAMMQVKGSMLKLN